MTPRTITMDDVKRVASSLNPRVNRSFIQSLYTDAVKKEIKFADETTLSEFASIAVRLGFGAHTKKMLKPGAVLIEPTILVSISVSLEELELPEKTLAAIRTGREFFGGEWSYNEINYERWVFPRVFPQKFLSTYSFFSYTIYDRMFLHLYSAHLHNLKHNFAKRNENSQKDWKLICEESEKAMMRTARSKTHEKEVLEFIANFYVNYTEGRNSMEMLAASRAIENLLKLGDVDWSVHPGIFNFAMGIRNMMFFGGAPQHGCPGDRVKLLMENPASESESVRSNKVQEMSETKKIHMKTPGFFSPPNIGDIIVRGAIQEFLADGLTSNSGSGSTGDSVFRFAKHIENLANRIQYGGNGFERM